MREGPSSCMGDRHVKRGERKTVFDDINILYGQSKSQFLLTGDSQEIELTKGNERNLMKTILRTPDKNKCGYLKECVIEYPSNKQERTKHLKRSTEFNDRMTYTLLQQMRITNVKKSRQKDKG